MFKDASSSTKGCILERREFKLSNFLGDDWGVARSLGRRIGNDLNVERIIVKSYLKEGEPRLISGEECLRRIRVASTDVQLDANDFMTLWGSEEGRIALQWLGDTKGIISLSFWGTILRDPSGDCVVLYLSRNHDGSWTWGYRWLDDNCEVDDVACLDSTVVLY